MKFLFLQLTAFLSLAASVHSLRGAERAATKRELNTGGSWLSILSTSFESGVGTDFEIGVNAVEHDMGDAAHHEKMVIKLDNSGPESFITSKSIDISTFDRVEVSFYYRGESLEDGDQFVMEFQNDGIGPWRTAKNFIQSSAIKDFNGSWHHQRLQWLTHDGIQNANTVKIRIHAQGDSADDTFLIDSFDVLGRARDVPTSSPTTSPSASPSASPEAKPSAAPSESPSASPEAKPSAAPSAAPSASPEAKPSAAPSESPSASPEAKPSAAPSAAPSASPEAKPSAAPSESPSASPEAKPSASPSASPSQGPTPLPTAMPTNKPPPPPTAIPTAMPTIQNSQPPVQTAAPTVKPTVAPTVAPTVKPTAKPTAVPTQSPTVMPVQNSAPPVQVTNDFECFAVAQGNRGKVQVGWDGADGTWVDISRNGEPVTTVRNKKGKWNDSGVNKGETHSYSICEQNTGKCCSVMNMLI